MVQIRKYSLASTERVPNNKKYSLIHYSKLIIPDNTARNAAGQVYDLFTSNGWTIHWIYRYGKTQTAHYHSRSHEAMCVLSGQARIRFGVADTSDDMHDSTYGNAFETGGIELTANVGDVFVIPAGVAHKTYDCKPEESFALLTPGIGRGIEAEDQREAVENCSLSGFTMCGAYPAGGDWDFKEGGRDHGDWENIWAVGKPERDPVLGMSNEGICGLW